VPLGNVDPVSSKALILLSAVTLLEGSFILPLSSPFFQVPLHFHPKWIYSQYFVNSGSPDFHNLNYFKVLTCLRQTMNK
jgi:hypothetical protein